jgi:hypothetical protein
LQACPTAPALAKIAALAVFEKEDFGGRRFSASFRYPRGLGIVGLYYERGDVSLTKQRASSVESCRYQHSMATF